MHESHVLLDLVIIFGVAIGVVAVLRRIGVPTIAGFIVAGALVGPHGLGLVGQAEPVELLAEVGVALLLFGIGLEMQLGRLRRLWRPVLIGGALQVGLTAGGVAGLAIAFGLDSSSALFLGMLLAVSSTAIVLRGLEQRGELESPHGRLTLGVLIFQDLCVVPMMLSIPLLAGDGKPLAALIEALGKSVGVLAVVLIAGWFVVPRVLHMAARTRQRDLFLLTVFVVCVGTAALVSTAGVSLALGAFLAGMVVAGSEYRHQALAELIPFREVFASLFFVTVGMLFDGRVLVGDVVGVLGLLAVILLGKFLVVFLAATLMRLPLRVCVLAAASLAQVGEFSFVLARAASGTDLLGGVLEDRFFAATILSMLVTPLAIAVGPRLATGASRIRAVTGLLGVRTAVDAEIEEGGKRDHVVIAGYGVTGQELAHALREADVPYVVLDLNPDNVRRARENGEPSYFGDVTSPEVLHHVGAHRAREIVIAVNDPAAAERAVRSAREAAPDVAILVRARFIADVAGMLEAGATEVVPAEIEAAVEIAARVLRRYGVDRERLKERLDSIRRHAKS
jgi:CPA2 family monovalent cation:H+ antiporter-2